MDTFRDIGLTPDQARAGLKLLLKRGALVQDGERIQLARLAEAEAAVARHVVRLRDGHCVPVPAPAGVWGSMVPDPLQEQALAYACEHAVSVLTGGPGRGKSAATRAITDALENSGVSVACCAFSARAAKVIAEATGRDASTIHRLLQFHPIEGFWFHAGNPLPFGAVIVDEASMVPVELFASLVAAIPNGGRLIIVGDVDQLPAIGAGRVLFDVLESNAVPVTRLTRIFRQASESRIPWFAKDVNEGRVPDLTVRGTDASFIDVSHDSGHCPGAPCEVCDRALGYVIGLSTTAITEQRGIPPERIQVLAAQRAGTLGVENLNMVLQHTLNPPPMVRTAESEFVPDTSGDVFIRHKYSARIRDRVIHKKNNYTLGVFNGEQGIVLAADPEGLDPDDVADLLGGAKSRDELSAIVIAVAVAATCVRIRLAAEAEIGQPICEDELDPSVTVEEGLKQIIERRTVTARILASYVRQDEQGHWYGCDHDGNLLPDVRRAIGIVPPEPEAVPEPEAEAEGGTNAKRTQDPFVLVVDFGDKRIAYTKSTARELELAYCRTVHDAQGGAADAIILTMPETHGFMLTRALVYTGITRARKFFVAVGATSAMAKAVRNLRGSHRRTTLVDRLRRAKPALPPSLATIRPADHGADLHAADGPDDMISAAPGDTLLPPML